MKTISYNRQTYPLIYPKLTRNPNLNPTLLTKDPSTQYRYYGRLCIAATDGDDTALSVRFTRVCFVKLMLVILFCNLVCVYE